MKQFEIKKITDILDDFGWQYNESQTESLIDKLSKSGADADIVVNEISTKYSGDKKPTIGAIIKLINNVYFNNIKKKSYDENCNRCNSGFVTVAEYYQYRLLRISVDQLRQIPIMSVSCDCYKNGIAYYLNKLREYSETDHKFYCLAIIKLWDFYRSNMEHNIGIEDFNPYKIWNVNSDFVRIDLFSHRAIIQSTGYKMKEIICPF